MKATQYLIIVVLTLLLCTAVCENIELCEACVSVATETYRYVKDEEAYEEVDEVRTFLKPKMICVLDRMRKYQFPPPIMISACEKYFTTVFRKAHRDSFAAFAAQSQKRSVVEFADHLCQKITNVCQGFEPRERTLLGMTMREFHDPKLDQRGGPQGLFAHDVKMKKNK